MGRHALTVCCVFFVVVAMLAVTLNTAFIYDVVKYDDNVSFYEFKRVSSYGKNVTDGVVSRIFKFYAPMHKYFSGFVSTPYSTDYLDFYEEIGYKWYWAFNSNRRPYYIILKSCDNQAKQYGAVACNFSLISYSYPEEKAGLKQAFQKSFVSYADYYGFLDISDFDSGFSNADGHPCGCYYFYSRYIYCYDEDFGNYYLYPGVVYVPYSGSSGNDFLFHLTKDGVTYRVLELNAEMFCRYKLYDNLSEGLSDYFEDISSSVNYDFDGAYYATFKDGVYDYHLISADWSSGTPSCTHTHDNYLVTDTVYLANDYTTCIIATVK